MKIKDSMMLVAMGVGGTLLYQSMRNGSMKRIMNKMKDEAKKTMDDLEDMM